MTEVHETNPITIAQNFVLAQTPEELQEAMGAIYCDCLARPVGMSRETAKYLSWVTNANLMDRVREAIGDGSGAENAAIALEDTENLLNPVFPAFIFRPKARQLALDVERLTSLDGYCKQRVRLLDEIQQLDDEEAQAISGRLVDRLTDLLIFEVLVEHADGDKVLDHQVRLWQMFHMAREKGQMQLAPYFLGLDEGNNVQFLLPCCIPMGAPAKVFYSCAGILKALSCQKDVWEYEILVRDLHDRVQTEVMQRICRGKDDADTQMLEELFALLRVATNSHSPAAWEYPRFEEIKNKLEED